MASSQIQSISELMSYRDQRSSIKESGNSMNLVTDSNQTVKGAMKKKKKLRKGRLTLRKRPLAADNESSSSGSEKVVAPLKRRRKTKRRSKQQSSESAVESLAATGREYGNNVSKRNVSKVSERLQATNKLSHKVSTKGAVSREYGDFFSCKTGLTHLETHRFDQIQSKGIKRFADEYLKKLKKCEEFESGHNVEPFASVRLQLLNGVGKSDMSRKYERLSDVRNNDEEGDKNVEATQPSNSETTNISAAAIKTIGIIKKFRNGESIEADLPAKKKNESSLAETTKDSKKSVVRSVSNRNNNIPNTNDENVAKKDSNQNAIKAAEGKVLHTNKTIEAKNSTTEKFDSKINKFLGKMDVSLDAQKKKMKRLPSITETPSEISIDLSLRQNPTEESLELPTQGNPSGKLPLSESGYVLMKKVLTSSENTLTIVDGKKWYDSKNRSVERHYAGKMPMSSASSVDRNKNILRETYQTTKGR